MVFDTTVNLDPIDIARAFALGMTNDEILEFIKELDAMVGEWPFTEMVYDFFKIEVEFKESVEDNDCTY